MTADDLRAWQKRMDYTNMAAARALGMSESGYTSLITGRNRGTGKPTSIDRRTELACAALEARLSI